MDMKLLCSSWPDLLYATLYEIYFGGKIARISPGKLTRHNNFVGTRREAGAEPRREGAENIVGMKRCLFSDIVFPALFSYD